MYVKNIGVSFSVFWICTLIFLSNDYINQVVGPGSKREKPQQGDTLKAEQLVKSNKRIVLSSSTSMSITHVLDREKVGVPIASTSSFNTTNKKFQAKYSTQGSNWEPVAIYVIEPQYKDVILNSEGQEWKLDDVHGVVLFDGEKIEPIPELSYPETHQILSGTFTFKSSHALGQKRVSLKFLSNKQTQITRGSVNMLPIPSDPLTYKCEVISHPTHLLAQASVDVGGTIVTRRWFSD